MPISRGSTPITDIRRGSTLINEVRRGSTLIWSRTTASYSDNFNRADSANLGANWTSLGPSTDWLLGIENNTARVKIPDGLIGLAWDLRTSRMRFNAATLPSDNGYVECRVATRGDGFSLTSLSNLVSQIFGRANTAGTYGVGIQMIAGSAWIVRRLPNLIPDVTMAGPVSFQGGDVLRLTFVNRNFTLTKNGASVATWNDTGGTSFMGSSYRSMVIRGDGNKDTLGPRRFSPAFDYVVMG